MYNLKQVLINFKKILKRETYDINILEEILLNTNELFDMTMDQKADFYGDCVSSIKKHLPSRLQRVSALPVSWSMGRCGQVTLELKYIEPYMTDSHLPYMSTMRALELLPKEAEKF